MLKETIVSDFDGVWTDPSKEAEKYTEAFLEELSRKVNVNLYELRDLMQAAGETIRQSPGIFGWEYKGMIVAPATADPYLFNQAAAKLTLNNLRAEKDRSIPSSNEAVKLMDQLFQECYPLTETAFREGAKEYLGELHRSGKLTIVTNSDTRKVEKKLFELFGAEDHGLKVMGNAKNMLLIIEVDGV